jgi:hypothetical protein
MRVLIFLVSFHGAALAARHVPPGDAMTNAALELVVEAPPSTPALTAHYRVAGTRAFTAQELVRRDDGHWVAVVPATAIAEPALEYYIDAGGQPVFASEQWPHATPVVAAPELARRERDEVRAEHHRYRVQVDGEYVDFGRRIAGGMQLPDNYYRLDTGVAYRLWAYPIEQIEIGYTRLVGDTLDRAGMGEAGTGYKVSGWFGVGLALAEGVRFDGRVMALATTEFTLGARAELRFGVLEASHIAVGAEYLADTGTNGYLRLGWGTVPGVPMAATVEVTSMPASYRNVGVRLFYDIAREVGAGVRLGVRVGYAARDQTIAGFTSGAAATWDF